MDLKLDADELNACVSCGLCLPFCPTYRVTGDEALSPRGRIALMRAVQNEDVPVTDEIMSSFETCVQCRGCEPACPSGVPFGHLMERTRETLHDEGKRAPLWLRMAYKPLEWPRALRAGSQALGLMQKTGLVPRSLGLPRRIPLRQPELVGG